MISTTAWLIVSDLSLHIEVLQLFSFLMSEFPSARQKAKKNSHIGFISSKNTFFIFVFIFFCIHTKPPNCPFPQHVRKHHWSVCGNAEHIRSGWTKLRLKYFKAVSQMGLQRNYKCYFKMTCNADHLVVLANLSTLTQTTDMAGSYIYVLSAADNFTWLWFSHLFHSYLCFL